MTETKKTDAPLKEKTKVAPTAETLPTVNPTATALVGDQTLKLPKTEKAGRGKQRTMTCVPGTIYTLPIGEGEKAVTVPFMLPLNVTKPVEVTVASQNPNWLGRDGEELRAHICVSELGTVILQPHGVGWKANVFATNRITIA